MAGTKVIKLSGKRAEESKAYAIVDEDDYDRLTSTGSWYLSDTGYAVQRKNVQGKKTTIRMHRLVNETPTGYVTDHINHNKLDNRKDNLRTVTQAENMCNLSDQGKGYYYDKSKRRWAVESRQHGVKSVYVESEKHAREYVEDLRAGREPTKVLIRRRITGGSTTTPEQIKRMHQLYSLGYTKRKIAKQFGLSETAVGRIINGKTWREYANTRGR